MAVTLQQRLLGVGAVAVSYLRYCGKNTFLWQTVDGGERVNIAEALS